MPSSIFDLIATSGAEYGGAVRWGDAVPEVGGGIYLISRLADPGARAVERTDLPIDRARLRELLDTRPELTLDGRRPSMDDLVERTRRLWLPDEPVLYIGKATSLSQRVRQYYVTPPGARSPHAGGWLLKTVEGTDRLYVHWATHDMPELAEQQVLATFVHAVSAESRNWLHDSRHLYPFANLEGPGGRKAHGIAGARLPSGSAGPPDRPAPEGFAGDATSPPRQPRSPKPAGGGGYDALTQPVTAVDKETGRVRVPQDAKWLFPPERGDLRLRFLGEAVTARWNPRQASPGKSGTLGVRRQRLTAVTAGTRLPIRRGRDRLEIG